MWCAHKCCPRFDSMVTFQACGMLKGILRFDGMVIFLVCPIYTKIRNDAFYICLLMHCVVRLIYLYIVIKQCQQHHAYRRLLRVSKVHHVLRCHGRGTLGQLAALCHSNASDCVLRRWRRAREWRFAPFFLALSMWFDAFFLCRFFN